MSDWHFGMDYDMWLYPPVDWTAPDYDYELPEPIEAANIEGTLLVNAEDAIEQVHCLQTENAKLRELCKRFAEYTSVDQCEGCIAKRACNAGELDMCWIRKEILEKLRELGIEVDGGTE